MYYQGVGKMFGFIKNWLYPKTKEPAKAEIEKEENLAAIWNRPFGPKYSELSVLASSRNSGKSKLLEIEQRRRLDEISEHYRKREERKLSSYNDNTVNDPLTTSLILNALNSGDINKTVEVLNTIEAPVTGHGGSFSGAGASSSWSSDNYSSSSNDSSSSSSSDSGGGDGGGGDD
jgi:hypothetical protein